MKILTEWTHEGVTYRTGDEIVIKDRGTFIFLSFIEESAYPVKYVNSLGGVDSNCVEDVVAPKKKVPFEQRDYDNIMKIVSKNTGVVYTIQTARIDFLVPSDGTKCYYEYVAENFTQLDGSSLYKEV